MDAYLKQISQIKIKGSNGQVNKNQGKSDSKKGPEINCLVIIFSNFCDDQIGSSTDKGSVCADI